MEVHMEERAIEPKEEETSAANKLGRYDKEEKDQKDEKERVRRLWMSKQNRYCWKIVHPYVLEGKSAMLTA
jgi:hypothetical protein